VGEINCPLLKGNPRANEFCGRALKEVWPVPILLYAMAGPLGAGAELFTLRFAAERPRGAAFGYPTAFETWPYRVMSGALLMQKVNVERGKLGQERH
jgi:hypothetical protein